MDNYLKKNFGYVKAKNSSEEELRRWRSACGLVKNRKRRFRYTANLSKRSEADAIRRAFKEVHKDSPVRPLNKKDSSDGDDEKEVHEDSPVGSLNKEDSSDGNDEKEVQEDSPVHPLNKEDRSDGDDGKVSKERTSPRRDDSDYFFSISDEDEESVGNTLSDNISEPVHNVSPNGSSRLRITSWQKGELLGRGSNRTVYEGISNDGSFFAIKEVSLLDPGSKARRGCCSFSRMIRSFMYSLSS